MDKLSSFASMHTYIWKKPVSRRHWLTNISAKYKLPSFALFGKKKEQGMGGDQQTWECRNYANLHMEKTRFQKTLVNGQL